MINRIFEPVCERFLEKFRIKVEVFEFVHCRNMIDATTRHCQPYWRYFKLLLLCIRSNTH